MLWFVVFNTNASRTRFGKDMFVGYPLPVYTTWDDLYLMGANNVSNIVIIHTLRM